jgi:hypothetical protein
MLVAGEGGAILGGRRPAQVEDNVAAADLLALSPSLGRFSCTTRPGRISPSGTLILPAPSGALFVPQRLTLSNVLLATRRQALALRRYDVVGNAIGHGLIRSLGL